MSEAILVNVLPQETRVAVVEGGVVQDIYIEREAGRGLVGNIYSGRVVRVLPGMQAAFVDFGMERTGFVHASDLAGVPTRANAGGVPRESGIENQLHDGQKLVVQVAKDPLGSKGARLTTELSVSSRFLVFLPGATRFSVSQRIDDAGERARLLSLLEDAIAEEGFAGEGGYILRTAAEGADLAGIRADVRFLRRLWVAISRRGREASEPRLLYEELPLHLRVARDLARPGLETVQVDDYERFLELQEFCEDYVPELCTRIAHYAGAGPLLDLYGAEAEIQGALARRVDLDCGGYLVIDQTEAMTTIDVNTGSFVGRRNLEETLLKTNLEAAVTLARQLRLRNLGGIIIADFIDMRDPRHCHQVLLALEAATARDPVRVAISGMSELGLVTVTRKRTRESLRQALCEDCPACQGRGVLKSSRTVCYEIFRAIIRLANTAANQELVVLAAQPVVSLLREEEAAGLAEVQRASGKIVHLRAEPMYSQEHFDIASL